MKTHLILPEVVRISEYRFKLQGCRTETKTRSLSNTSFNLQLSLRAGLSIWPRSIYIKLHSLQVKELWLLLTNNTPLFSKAVTFLQTHNELHKQTQASKHPLFNCLVHSMTPISYPTFLVEGLSHNRFEQIRGIPPLTRLFPSGH